MAGRLSISSDIKRVITPPDPRKKGGIDGALLRAIEEKIIKRWAATEMSEVVKWIWSILLWESDIFTSKGSWPEMHKILSFHFVRSTTMSKGFSSP